MRTVALMFLCLTSACATTPGRSTTQAKLISPESSGMPTAWTRAEQAAPFAIRNLRRTPEASFHVVRVGTELVARLHEKADLTLVAVSGTLKLTLGDQSFEVTQGDVIEIPRGRTYGAKNLGSDAGVLYQIFTPALATDDTQEKPGPTDDGPWQYNLWLQ